MVHLIPQNVGFSLKELLMTSLVFNVCSRNSVPPVIIWCEVHDDILVEVVNFTRLNISTVTGAAFFIFSWIDDSPNFSSYFIHG